MTDDVMSDSGVNTPVESTPNIPASDVKTMHQSQIDAIVRDAHHRGYSKRDKEYAASQAQPTQFSGMTPEEVRKMVADESAKQIQDAQMRASADLVVNQFQQKMQAAASKYPDFAQQVGKLDLGKMVDLVQMTSSLDNTGDIMYDLAQNPYKIASLQQLAQMQPQLAYSELQKLSSSIKANQSQSAPDIKAPLSQVNSSPIGISSDGLPDWDHFSRRYKG